MINSGRGEKEPLETVTVTSEGPVAHLTIDRPKKMNALNPQVIREIREALRELEGSGYRALDVCCQVHAHTSLILP
jgi:enoyl-CoA hydratase/carnithine racemase